MIHWYYLIKYWFFPKTYSDRTFIVRNDAIKIIPRKSNKISRADGKTQFMWFIAGLIELLPVIISLLITKNINNQFMYWLIILIGIIISIALSIILSKRIPPALLRQKNKKIIILMIY